MARHLAALALVFSAIAQAIILWPLPDEMARRTARYWTDLKSKAEAIDPSKSERPAYDAEAKTRILQSVESMLNDPSAIRRQAWLHWCLWLGATLLTATAAIAFVRRWRHWWWIALASTAMYFWLQRPLSAFSFYVDGRFDFEY